VNQNNKIWKSKKIIHIDMDSFYASIEISEKPFLKHKPVAVGGKPTERGVLTTCNYIARKYGIHSAMSSKKAMSLCKKLIILPVDVEKYKTISEEIFKIFKCYSKKIEPVSVDEAYIDVTHSEYCRGDPEEMAKQMRACILKDFKITASAGISCNKLISKICSDLKKPNNQYRICDDEIPEFIKNVRLNKLPGIGKVNFKKCLNLNMEYCKDMYNYSVDELINIFGVYGNTLYNFIRGVDNRKVDISRVRKSISVEDTFLIDLSNTETCISKINHLFDKLTKRCKINNVPQNLVKEIFIKIKFNNFQTITRQSKCNEFNSKDFIQLFMNNIDRVRRPIRLLGLGFTIKDKEEQRIQYDIFNR
jgi:DNA polymerase-4